MDRNWRSWAAIVSLRTGKQKILLEDAANPRYLPTGHLVFTRPGMLFAVPFSLKLLEVSGPPVSLLDDLLTNYDGTRGAEFAFSQEGTLVYMPTRALQRTLVWVDRKGGTERVPFPAGSYKSVALSPDGGRFVVIAVDKGEKWALLIGDLVWGTLSRSTAEGIFHPAVVWTPDGKRVAFSFSPAGEGLWRHIFWQSADLGAPPECVTSQATLHQELPTSFSPDGRLLLLDLFNFSDTSSSLTLWDIFVLPLTGERTLRPFLQTKSVEASARFSPDGRWVAYNSNESGRYEVFVRPFPGPGGKWQISTEGGDDPHWSRRGRELFYQQEDKLMIVDVETKPTFRAERPRMLFEGSFLDYDVSPDGTRFLMIKPDPAETSPAHVNVVLNWFEEVKRRVPGAK